jgi:proteasome lid subunit RPN8/RPN11
MSHVLAPVRSLPSTPGPLDVTPGVARGVGAMSFQRVIDGIFRVEGTCSVAYGPARWTAAGGESHFYPELPKTVSASISSSAISKIRTEIKDALKGLECGGFLVAHLDSLDRIVAATGEGPDTIVSRTSVELLFQPLEDLAEIAPHLSLAGDWHLHVEGSDMPSSTDRRAWVTGARRAGGFWTGLIARPAPSWLEPPTLSAWATYCVGGDSYVCERAHLVEV